MAASQPDGTAGHRPSICTMTDTEARSVLFARRAIQSFSSYLLMIR